MTADRHNAVYFTEMQQLLVEIIAGFQPKLCEQHLKKYVSRHSAVKMNDGVLHLF